MALSVSYELKLDHGYTLSTVREINFGIIFLTPTWNSAFKQTAKKSFHPKSGKNQKPNVRHSISYNLP